MLVFALAAGFSGGLPQPASAQPSHAGTSCHGEAAPASHGPGDAAMAQHLCLGCGVVAPRLGELPAMAAPNATPGPRLAGPNLTGRMISPDTPPPRSFS